MSRRTFSCLFALFASSLSALVAAPTPPAPAPAVQAHLDQAAADAEKRDYAGAVTEYDAVIALAPQTEAAWRLRGQAHSELDQGKQAYADETQALTLDPKDAQAYLIRSRLYRPEHLARALADAKQAVALAPASAPAHFELGQLYDRQAFKAGFPNGSDKADRDLAIAEYTQALTLPDGMPFAAFARADDYKAEGDTERALADYAQALKVLPHLDLVYWRRADISERKFDFERAATEYTQLISANSHPDLLPEIYVRRGTALLRKGDYAELSRGPDDEQAIADFTRAIETADSDSDDVRAQAYANRAVAYGRRGEAAKAALDRAEADRLDAMERAKLRAWKAAGQKVIVTPHRTIVIP